ncbi:Orotidine 5'-phosphate decarboxylase [Grifola frondosa]|uniref:Orotidine 5'-phosphate decarboxylase n=1 Tax=Grifola frondosa TaxID=5627 RepID=A0A1C7M002_GRIFR|nr:Orotidine 5'-phosphate decarboxylase [Grifola frondosa]
MFTNIRPASGQTPQPGGKTLLETIERKKSNLCVSVDVTKQADFLRIIDVVGPYICLVKTHVDVIEDFEPTKFADIGNTVALQYSSGVYKIASWSHITNAHPVPGPSIFTGLSSGSLATGSYTEAAVQMARTHRDFVIGFIAQHRMDGVGLKEGASTSDEDFLILTPGVGLDSRGDSMGQQYRTPKEVVLESGCDVIIVGRGIYGKDNGANPEAVRAQAERYRSEGWAAYQERLCSS